MMETKEKAKFFKKLMDGAKRLTALSAKAEELRHRRG